MYKNCTKNVPKNVQNDTWYTYTCMYVCMYVCASHNKQKTIQRSNISYLPIAMFLRVQLRMFLPLCTGHHLQLAVLL